MAFCWRANDAPLIVVFWSFLPLINLKKNYQNLTTSDRTFWIHACRGRLWSNPLIPLENHKAEGILGNTLFQASTQGLAFLPPSVIAHTLLRIWHKVKLMAATNIVKVIRLQRSGIDTIKYHTWPRIPMGKWQTQKRHHKREPRGQPFPSRWLQSTYKQTCTKHSKHKTEQKHKRSTKEVPPWNGQ